MQSQHFNWLSLFILGCLLCADVSARNSRCRSPSILRVRLRPLTVDGGSVLGCWHSWSPVPGFLTVGLNRQCWNCCKMKRGREREERSKPEARATGRHPAFRETNSKFESIHLKGCSSVKVLLSAVAGVWCLKGFRRDQGVADVD